MKDAKIKNYTLHSNEEMHKKLAKIRFRTKRKYNKMLNEAVNIIYDGLEEKDADDYEFLKTKDYVIINFFKVQRNEIQL